MHTLFLICSLVAAGVAAFFALDARRHAVRCETHTNRMRASQGRITGLEGSTESLLQQLQKLRGQFHAFKAAVEDGPAELFRARDPEPVNYPAPRDPRNGQTYDICPNYVTAQQEGPSSDAALCECSYCMAVREQRARFRAEAIPRTAQGQAKLARLNAGKTDGE